MSLRPESLFRGRVCDPPYGVGIGLDKRPRPVEEKNVLNVTEIVPVVFYLSIGLRYLRQRWAQFIALGQAKCGFKLENVATSVGLQHSIKQAAKGVKQKVALKSIAAMKIKMYIVLWSNMYENTIIHIQYTSS